MRRAAPGADRSPSRDSSGESSGPSESLDPLSDVWSFDEQLRQPADVRREVEDPSRASSPRPCPCRSGRNLTAAHKTNEGVATERARMVEKVSKLRRAVVAWAWEGPIRASLSGRSTLSGQLEREARQADVAP
jgi:hypothetical protein